MRQVLRSLARRPFWADERGIVLPLALAAFVVGVFLASALAQAVNSRAQGTKGLDSTLRTYYSREMAVQHLLWRMEYDATFWTMCSSIPVLQGNVGHGAYMGCVGTHTLTSVTTSIGETYDFSAKQFGDTWRITMTKSGVTAAYVVLQAINDSGGVIITRILSWEPQ